MMLRKFILIHVTVIQYTYIAILSKHKVMKCFTKIKKAHMKNRKRNHMIKSTG